MAKAIEISFPDVACFPRSYWAVQGTPPRFPTFGGTRTLDVAIAGAGYLGLWTALLLKRQAPHLEIAVLEAQGIADGPSGRNGGLTEGFWGKLPLLESVFGTDEALTIALAGDECAATIRALSRNYPDTEIEDGPLGFVANHDWQCAAVASRFAAIERIADKGNAERAGPEKLSRLFPSGRFVDGILYPAAFSIQPAALVRALATEAANAGVEIYERSAIVLASLGDGADIVLKGGAIRARHFVQATGAWTSHLPLFKNQLTNFSSHICLTEPIPGLLDVVWPGRKPFYDARPFINYLRVTKDQRVMVGSGSGNPSYRNRITISDFQNPAAWKRARHALHTFVPGSEDVAFDSCWGGPIDISSDRLPFVGTFPHGTHYFGAGQSGHGIVPSCVMAHCIASTLLGKDDRWSRLKLNRGLPRKCFPFEPLRYAGGRLIHAATLRHAANLDQGRKSSALDRLLLATPTMLGLDLGLR